MQIVISDSVSNSDKVIINNAIKAIFETKSLDINSFSGSRTLVISTNEKDQPDYIFNISHFLGSNISFKLLVLKNLANKIFSDYVDPRLIIDKYDSILKQKEKISSPIVIIDQISSDKSSDSTEENIYAVNKNFAASSGKNWFKK